MDELEAAINTYRILILNDDMFDILESSNSVSLLIDLSDFPNIDLEDILDAANYCIRVFEKHEHYEKCQDLLEYINEINYGTERLPEENS